MILMTRDTRVWEYIVDYKRIHDDSPSIREIAAELVMSTATVQKAITNLIAAGKISRPSVNGRRKARTIKILEFPIDAIETLEGVFVN